jgi:shikimate 5-dehydrogenase
VIDLDGLARYEGRPLYLFVGIDTAGSRVHQAFPHWAERIGLDADLKGLDLPVDAGPATWERLVTTMRDNPSVHGAVITSHKLRVYRHAGHLMDVTEPLVALTHEVNSLDTRGPVRAFARDAQSLDVLLNGPAEHLADGRPIDCLGSGGSAIALLLATQTDLLSPRDRRPELTIVGLQEDSLADVRAVLDRAKLGDAPVRLRVATGPAECAALIAGLDPTSLIVNATGLGKSGPGSPLPDAGAFPPASAAWDFNYRGPLTFLEQARTAGVPYDDGWDYFLAGWACALAAITDRAAAHVLAAFRELTPR